MEQSVLEHVTYIVSRTMYPSVRKHVAMQQSIEMYIKKYVESRTQRRYRWILRPTLGQVLPLKGSHNNTLFVPALSMSGYTYNVEQKYKCEKNLPNVR